MTENSRQPRPDDAVLGGQNPQLQNAVVLGGLEGVKQRLATDDIKQINAALPEALKYGQDGLELLICALTNKSWQVRCDAYSLLQENTELGLKQGLQTYNPYLLKCFHTLSGHSGTVNSVAFSPDSQTLASGSADDTIKLWDVETGQLKSTLTGHSGTVNSVAFSPNGQTLASGSYDDTIKLWDVETGQLKITLTGHSLWVNSVAFSPNNRHLASASGDKTIKLWDIETGQLKNTLTGHLLWVNSVVFSPDGRALAGSSYDNTIKLWDVETGQLKHTLTGHSDSVYAVAFSPDSNSAALASLRASAVETLEASDRTIASGSDDETIKLWDVETCQLKHTLTGHSDSVYLVAFSPDGQTLTSGSYDQTIRLWDVKTGQLKGTLTGHSDSVYAVAFSPDSEAVALASLRASAVATLGASGRTIASGSDDNTIKLWRQNNSTQSKLDPLAFFQRYLMLKDALKSGETGLELLIQSLKDEFWSVREAAYYLLQESDQPKAKQALQGYSPDLGEIQ